MKAILYFLAALIFCGLAFGFFLDWFGMFWGEMLASAVVLGVIALLWRVVFYRHS